MEEKCEHQLLTRGGGIRCAPPGGAHDTANAGPRTVPVRSGLSGVKPLEFSGPPRPSDVLPAGTARAPVGVSRCAAPRAVIKDLDNLKYAMALFVAQYNMTAYMAQAIKRLNEQRCTDVRSLDPGTVAQREANC